MDRNPLIAVAAIVSVINGLFSPWLLTVFLLWPVWFPTLVVPVSGNFVLFFASLIVSISTLMFSAAAASLFERVTGAKETTTVSAAIWLGASVLLSWEAIVRLLKMGGF